MLVSAGTHALLLLLTVAGVGFVRSVAPPPPDIESMEILTFVPDFLVDQPVVGGGEPPAGQPSPPAATPPPVVQTPPPKPAPEVKPAPKAEPPAVKPVVERQPPKKVEPEPPPPSETGTKPPPKKHVVQPNLTPVVKKTPESKQPTKAEQEAAQAAAAAANARRVAQAIKSRINSAVTGISGKLSSSTTVTVPGGTGGASYASYSLYVKSVYQWAWRAPSELTDDSATATAKIVIARDGTILSARIETPSRVPALDKSVRAALDRVTTIGKPFPDGAKDDERTFLIDFNLKAKQFTG